MPAAPPLGARIRYKNPAVAATDSPDNPLLDLPFEIPFDRIEPGQVEPAVKTLLERAEAEVEAIAGDDSPRTYANTLQRLEQATLPLERAVGVVAHLESVATAPELREAYNAIQPLVSAFYSQIPLHPGLWNALKSYAETDEAKTGLDATRSRLLKKTLEDFRRHGADLADADKKKLHGIDVELAQTTTRFAQHVLDATAAWELLVEDESKLAGLPDSAKEAARESAQQKGLDGWRLTLQEPSYVPVMTYLDDPGIREQVYRAMSTRATAGEGDNRPLIGEILRLRAAKAKLLGFANFADFVLEDRMAKSGDRARAFVRDLESKSEAAFRRENQELLAFRRELEGADAPALKPWDVAYYAEKQRRAKYDFDEELLRPYYPVDKVIQGLFETASALYGVQIERREGLPTWDPSVTTYEIREGSTFVGLFYMDLFPRETKRDGAWMNGLFTGGPTPNGFEPHSGLVCANLHPPVGDRPALLTHRQVETLFHEFGHLLHHLLSRVEVKSLAGTNVAWDFVELPSQIMENWCWEKEALDRFAHHWETGERIPDDMFAAMKATRTYRAANAMMRQLGFADTDLALHVDYDAAKDPDVVTYARDHMQRYAPAPYPADYAMICSFQHLFAGPVAYASAYYSYKWAEVLDADAFSRFKREGLFAREVGDAFRDAILARGDSRDPMDLFVEFMGREPKLEPLLERAGLAPN